MPFWCVRRRDTIRRHVEFSGLYPFKAGALAALLTLVVGANLRRHHRFARFGPANQVTAGRAILVTLIAALIGEPASPAFAKSAAELSLIVLILDGVDGWLARRTGLVSDFGARFDMEVDALLILVLSILAWQYEKAGAWVVASGLLRYAFVGAGWIWGWLRNPLPSSWRGKVICVAQELGLIVTISPVVPWPASAVVAGMSLAALAFSFLVDVVRLWRQSDR
jgi:phosphatidylglycerophosphate synthase